MYVQQMSIPAYISHFMQGRGGVSFHGGGPQRLLSEGKGVHHSTISMQAIAKSC